MALKLSKYIVWEICGIILELNFLYYIIFGSNTLEKIYIEKYQSFRKKGPSQGGMLS